MLVWIFLAGRGRDVFVFDERDPPVSLAFHILRIKMQQSDFEEAFPKAKAMCFSILT